MIATLHHALRRFLSQAIVADTADHAHVNARTAGHQHGRPEVEVQFYACLLGLLPERFQHVLERLARIGTSTRIGLRSGASEFQQIFIEVDVQLGDEIVRPDLAGWRRERLPEPDLRPITTTPDWICEVLSESNEAHDRVTKRRLYAQHGVCHYWIVDPEARIVDPEARTLEALSLEHGRWVDAGSFDATQIVRIVPFEHVDLPVGRLFLPRKSQA